MEHSNERFSGFIISQRMNKAINKNWQSLMQTETGFCLLELMGLWLGEYKEYCNRDMNDYLDGNIFPKLGSWTDTGAADAYKYALNTD